MSTIGGVGSWQPPQPYTPPNFSQLDSNSDGGISLDEFEAGAPKAASGSGTSQSAAQQQRAEALFNKIDTNSDGSVSSAELNTFESQATQQQASQQFLTQLMASGQSGASDGTGAAGKAHHGGHHHGGGGGGVAQIGESDSTSGTTSADGSTTSTDGSAATDGTDDALTTLEGILDGTPTDGTAAGATATAATDGSSSPLDLLTAASNAYSANANASSLWSSLSPLLQDAA